MIVESYALAATDSDVLAAPSRLAAIPYGGTLIIEMQANLNAAANNYAVTIQLPDGSTPLDAVTVPAGVTAGAINMDDKYTVSFPVAQGGHVLISATETGTTLMDFRCTLMP